MAKVVAKMRSEKSEFILNNQSSFAKKYRPKAMKALIYKEKPRNPLRLQDFFLARKERFEISN